MKTIEAVDKKICTGCGACYNACPKDAISMIADEEGFLFPSINHDRCVDCGVCLKSCAAYNPHYNNNKEPKCYAVWANDEIRMKSSSGGMFTLLANYVLEQGGYVCGAAWDANLNVEHIIIHDKKELDRLRYSKYVQSNTKKVYSEIGKLLKEGHKVLFTGTPCQVAGIYDYLKRDYDNLITADVVCHGTPSQKVWQDFLSTLPYRKEIVHANFRPKEDGWWAYRLTFKLKGGGKVKLQRSNPYFLGFERALYSRRSCGTCPFNHLPRQADITLGDFWGIQFYDKPLFHPKGTSCVMVNNEKGQHVFDDIRADAVLVKEKPLAQALEYNKCFHAPWDVNNYKRSKFFNLRRINNFEKSVEFAVRDKYDVGIIGIWYLENYGAILTAYALYNLLRSMNFLPILIDTSGWLNNAHLEDPSLLSRRFFRRFGIQMTSIKRSSKELSIYNHIVDNFVLTSDQLWHYPKPYGKTFFLDFAHDDKRKVSIATSFGDGYIDPPSEWEEARFHMQRLDRISVREDSGVEICEKMFGVKAKRILDPVFLCASNEYEKVISRSKIKIKEKYLLCYVLDGVDQVELVLHRIADKMNLKLILIGDVETHRKGTTAQTGIEVEDWLYYIKNATAIVTDSFHGTCFAMLFHKPFISLVNHLRGADRFKTLINVFGERERFVFDCDHIMEHTDVLEYFDQSRFEQVLREEREQGIAWIREALNFKKSTSISVYDILSKEIEQGAVPSQAVNTAIPFSKEIASLLFNMGKIKRKVFCYGVLMKITWGALRRKSRSKYDEYKTKYEKIRQLERGSDIEAIKGNEGAAFEKEQITSAQYTVEKGNTIEIHESSGGKRILRDGESIPGLHITAKGSNNKIVLSANSKFNQCDITINATASTVNVESGCDLNNLHIYIISGKNQHLSIGKRVLINGADIVLEENSECYIKEECLLGKRIHIRASDAHSILDCSTGTVINKISNPIVLGKHCWIAHDVTILKNVQLGDNTIVANKALVTRSFPEGNLVIGGVPARIMRRGVRWDKSSPFQLELSK